MSLKLQVLDANGTLGNLQIAIGQTEQLGFQLVTVSMCQIESQPANLVTFRRLAPGSAPGPLSLISVPPANTLNQQQDALNSGEAGGKQLVCYATIFVAGAEANVAALRGWTHDEEIQVFGNTLMALLERSIAQTGFDALKQIYGILIVVDTVEFAALIRDLSFNALRIRGLEVPTPPPSPVN